jgi:hypothetical protein
VIVGAAVIPSAPLLVPGVSRSLPDGAGPVCDAVDAAVEALPHRDVTVLVAPAHRGRSQGLYDTAEAHLGAIGRPDITARHPIHRPAAEAVSRVIQYPMFRAEPLPLELAVLALLVGSGPLVPLAVPTAADFDALVGAGTAIAEALSGQDIRAVLIAAGDLSAGLDERSPLHRVDGAREWDDRATDIVDSGRLDGLRRLGPAEAQRVGALGWAPMAVLHGACARAKIGMVVRAYAAPAGVGYLVAQGA